MSLNLDSAKTSLKSARQVPTLSLEDFSSGNVENQKKFSEALMKGFQDYGFVILTDHGVSKADLDLGYEVLKKTFSLPTEVKLKYQNAEKTGQRGYTPFGQEHAKGNPIMDLKEFWHAGRNTSKQPNIWPAEIPEFEKTFTKLFNDLERAGKIMLDALDAPLGYAPGTLSGMVENGESVLRLLHYPPIPKDVDPRCVRAAAHEDINFITLLPAATAAGLQLKDRDGTWLDVDAENGSLIVDSGDMLLRLTNGLIPSTTHQVVNTPEATDSSRYSMPFFMHPRSEVVLRDITAGEFLNQRLREIGLLKN